MIFLLSKIVSPEYRIIKKNGNRIIGNKKFIPNHDFLEKCIRNQESRTIKNKSTGMI